MTRAYRALLRLYPTGFRREYGDEMTAIFAARAARASTIGRFGLLAAAFAEIMVNAFGVHWEILRQDLRHTARTLRRSPGFALTAILVTALGVGANTAAFSVADFVLLRPLGFPDPESLVRLCAGPRTGPVGWGCMNQLAPAVYRDYREQTTSFSALGAFQRDAVNLVGGGEPERVTLARVTTDVLPLLGVRPLLGSVFSTDPADAGTRSVVLGHTLWQTRFGGDRSVIGRTVTLDGAPHVVVGIMPATFHFPTRDVQMWSALHFTPADFETRGNNYLEAVGRLAPGVTFERARADLDRVVDRLAQQYPESADVGVSFFRMREEFSPRFKLMLQALAGASLCILLLACANLGNLLLARASAREREIAVRAALGAGRDRLVRQMITESVTLAFIGGVTGVVLALLLFPLVSLLVPPTLPIPSQPSLNLRMLGMAALFTALTGIGFGIVPAIRAGGSAAFGALRVRGGGGRQRMRAVLVAIEVAACVVLLVSSGLLMRAMLRVLAVDPGFQSENVLSVRTVLPKPKYDNFEKRAQFYNAVMNEVRSQPGVQSAGYTSGLPMIMQGGIATVTLPGQEEQPDGEYLISRRYVTPEFFDAMGIPILSGRDFSTVDDNGRTLVAVVSKSFAERYWPDSDPLGRAFLFRDSTWRVIGVVGDVKVRGLERDNEPQLYVPASVVPEGVLTFYDPKDLIIRTSGDPKELLDEVRAIVRRVDPEQPISDVMTLNDLLDTQAAPRRAQVRVLGALAAIALLVAGLGIYGLLAYSVTQQRQEIGVRLALGAQPRRIARRIVWNGMTIVMLGAIPGLLVALLAGRAMSAMLFGVEPADTTTLFITIGLCVVMALVGAAVPALRAVRVSPMTVMRAE
jgi:predicted permease